MSQLHDESLPKQMVKASLLGALHQITKTTPDKTWVYYPKTSDLKDGWTEISYRDLSYAVDGLSRWIDTNVSLTSPDEVVSYMGINDIRYILALLTLMNLGLKTLFASPRNSPEGQRNLFNVTNCKTLLYSEAFDIDQARESLPGITTYQIPSFNELVQSGKDNEPFPSRYSGEVDEPILILHTSGSTGMPKPIYLTNGFISVMSDLKTLPTPEGRSNAVDRLAFNGKQMFTMMPFFHMASFMPTSRSFFDPGPLVVCPTGGPINSEMIIEVLNQMKPNSGIFAPSMLEELISTDRGLDALSHLDFLVWVGGPIAHDSGERIRQRTNLATLMGTTEAGLLPNLVPEDSAEWHYYEWNPNSGIEMDPEDDGLFECVIRPTPDHQYQAVFHTFPDIKEWRTKDLYARHPTKPDLYEYKGRKDDVLVLSNGEKVQPVTFEKSIEDHPLVQGALVIGQGRFQTGLVIEPVWEKFDENAKPEELVEELWPTVEHANENLPSHGKVWRSKIAIAKSAKPFARAGKGSILRRPTIKMYEAEIEALYANENMDEQLGKLDENADADTVRTFIRQAMKLVSPDFPQDTSDDLDFFSTGLDSLQVMGLSTSLSHACSLDKPVNVAFKDIYANPSVDALANYILTARGHGEVVIGPKREEGIVDMLKKYTDDLPKRGLPVVTSSTSHTVILTGSTGALGNYILQGLISDPQVSQIYCLNRSADAETRQSKSFKTRNVTPDFTKVTFLQTDFSNDRFNLEESTYTTLLKSATIFIHNAWTVDFNKTLTSYETTHVAGTRRVVDFALSSTHNTNLYFISSIAAVSGWSTLSHPESKDGRIPTVPEQTFEDPRTTIPQGYSESKHIAEHILRLASERSGVPSTVLRAGQLAGPSDKEGIWNPHEWLPSIVSTSKSMNLIPETLGNVDTVDWVPINAAAKIVLDLVFARVNDFSSKASSPPAQEVYHLINPRTSSWSSLTPALKSAFGPSARVVPYNEWVDALKQVDTSDKDEVARKPGVKLLDFYQGLADGDGEGTSVLETAKTEATSVTMQKLGAVDGNLMENWLRQWGLTQELCVEAV